MANPTTEGEIRARIADLKQKLAARERLPAANWGRNVAAIRAEITKLESRLAASDHP